jgi:hypothetical protein
MTTWKQPFSINRIVHSLIPHRHRQIRMVAWVKVFVSYLVYVRDNLWSFWDTTWLDAAITPQVCYIEKALNLRFGRDDIVIEEGNRLGPFIYLRDVEPETEFYMDQEDSYVYTVDDTADCDFIVVIPSAIEADAPLIAALVHRYKLPGKKFIIQRK